MRKRVSVSVFVLVLSSLVIAVPCEGGRTVDSSAVLISVMISCLC